MKAYASTLVVVGLLLVVPGFAKDKSKPMMPLYVLQARTVAVLIDPDAGASITDPQENLTAQRDVETALLNWGRYQPQIATQDADLVIVIRRGHGKLISPTIRSPRLGNRTGVIEPTDSGINVGAQSGQGPRTSPPGQTPDESPRIQNEAGSPDDYFAVYDGQVQDGPLLWRYMAKDALKPHNVPAVAEFRKAVAEAEKAAAKHP